MSSLTDLSSSLFKLVNIAINNAKQSTLSLKHGAVLFSSMSKIIQTSCNGSGHRVCGFDAAHARRQPHRQRSRIL